MLIDTSGLLCLHYPTEPLHSLACTAYKRATVRLTHSYIIAGCFGKCQTLSSLIYTYFCH
jgi:hypothetical protein